MKKKILKSVIIIIIAVLVLLAGIAYAYYRAFMHPYRGSVKGVVTSEPLDTILTQEQAIEDLEHLYTLLTKRHPAWIDGSNIPTAVKEAYDTELSNIDGDITVLELWRSAGRILSVIHDGHTYVSHMNSADSVYLSDFTQLKEYKYPLSIDGVEYSTILETYKTMASYETEDYIEKVFAKIIVRKNFLTLCGIDTSDGVDMVFDTPDGQKEYHYTFVTADKIIGYEPSTNDEWVYYTIDKENNLGVFTLTTCVNNDEYKSVLDNFFQEVFANSITNIAVDLRGNGGGNSMVANEFITYLDVEQYNSWDYLVRKGWYAKKGTDIVMKNKKKPRVFDGDVYILTDVFTYSSAMDFAQFFCDNDLGTLVGQASGNMPNAYGDIVEFQLPNSNLLVWISFKKWYRIDQSKADEPLTPDYVVEPEDALSKVYELISGK